MKIALFTDTYYPDLNGVSISVANLAKSLRKRGHKVYIFGPKIKGYKDSDKNVFRLSSFKVLSNLEPNIYTPTLLPNREFRKMLSMDFDLVHAHGNGPYSVLGYFVCKIKRIPFVMTFHTMHTEYTHYLFEGKVVTPRMVRILLKSLTSLCDVIFTPSEKMKKELQRYGVKKEIDVAPNFLDSERFRDNKKNFLRELLNLKKDDQIIFTAARIGKEKNLDFVLRMFKKVYSSNPKAHLVIAGQGPKKTELERLSAKLGISKRVHFTGLIDYDLIPSAYSDSDIFVFASSTETQGIVVLEAITAGIPVVVLKDDAYSNMVYDNKNGFLVENKSTNDFAEKINLLLKDKKLREQFSKYSKQVVKDFDEELLTDNMIRIYKKILK